MPEKINNDADSIFLFFKKRLNKVQVLPIANDLFSVKIFKNSCQTVPEQIIGSENAKKGLSISFDQL